MMKITYINHSGFLIETRDCYYIFDYYKGELPHLDKEKEVIVFCSHFHEDHFNPQIFGILEDMAQKGWLDKNIVLKTDECFSV